MSADQVFTIDDVELGDVVRLPDGRALTARARSRFPRPVGSMAGFVILGELEVMAGTPANAGGNVLVYVPITYLPAQIDRAREVYTGACRYWAPHLPSIGSAMGELAWRVVEVAGSLDPIVITFRSGEPVVWIKATTARGSDLRFLPMARGNEHDQPTVARESGWVTSPAQRPVRDRDRGPVRRLRR